MRVSTVGAVAVIVMVASLTAGVLGLPFPDEEEVLPVDAGDPDNPSVAGATSSEDSDDKHSVSSEVGNLVDELSKYFFGSPRNETGAKLAQWNEKSLTNPEEVGEYFQGDIIQPLSRNGLRNKLSRWPQGVVHYQLSPSFRQSDVDMIQKAIRAYHKLTCIRFRPYTGREDDYLYVTSENTGCWSSVGRIGGRQEVNLQSPGCTGTVGTPAHEIMHALGFLHEQNRYERDNFVKINWENIQTGRELNFKKSTKKESYAYGVKYDYNSVMHYSGNAFSTNGDPTIEPLISKSTLGQRKGLSKGDVTKINAMYKSECQKRKGKRK